MKKNPNSAAIAAFDLCDSLLLALEDCNVLTKQQVMAILQDVADVYRSVPSVDQDRQIHYQAAEHIECLIKSRTVRD